jgi:voltage-gated potassium channel
VAAEPQPRDEEFQGSNWELFILALSFLSLANMVLLFLPLEEDTDFIVAVIDFALCFFFVIDFVHRLLTASSKRGYFFRGGGWLDLIGSIPLPGFRIARLFRVARVLHSIRIYGVGKLADGFRSGLANAAILIVVFLVLLVLEFWGMGILAAERGAPDANIESGGDALWWGFVSITTVGYGDRFPVTIEGRIVGTFVLAIGVALFGTVTGFVANLFLSPRPRKARAGDPATRLDELEELLGEMEGTTSALREKLGEMRTAL